MAASVQELEIEILSLSAEDRTRLLERLLESFEPSFEVQEAWIEEALRREAEVIAGEVELVPGVEALARVRARLA